MHFQECSNYPSLNRTKTCALPAPRDVSHGPHGFLPEAVCALLSRLRAGEEPWKQILFSWAPKSLWTVIAAMKLKDTCFLEGKL